MFCAKLVVGGVFKFTWLSLESSAKRHLALNLINRLFCHSLAASTLPLLVLRLWHGTFSVTRVEPLLRFDDSLLKVCAVHEEAAVISFALVFKILIRLCELGASMRWRSRREAHILVISARLLLINIVLLFVRLVDGVQVLRLERSAWSLGSAQVIIFRVACGHARAVE